jgi:diguanylate cyclase (GGDEF)-like protein
MSSPALSAAGRLKRIRESYIKQLPAQLEKILAAYAAYRSENPDQAKLQELHRFIHTLRGSSVSFGLSQVSAAAALAEKSAKEALLTGEPHDSGWYRQMEQCLAQMECEVAAIDASQETSLQGMELIAAAETSQGKEMKTIYLCEDDFFQRQTLATQIGCFGFQVISFGELEQMRDAVRNSPPDAIVMDLMFPGRSLGGAELMAEIQAGRECAIPTVFVSSKADLTSRLSAVRAGSSAYFTKPVNATELCATLSRLTSADTPDPYRIMIVDDDPHLAEMYATVLQESGMITLTLNDPLQALEPLFEFKPDLILTDMYMPGCNGMELAQAIRQIGTSFSIPIVYLSSETDSDKQFHAMRVGGDEFLTKPISSERLISAVAGRAERMKIIRSLMVRDGMTGLFNHTASNEQLEMAIAGARRDNKELCFAMIDLDKFKLVNDTYGHPVGDQVLITLARLLQQRLRKTDVVGRLGGEEFAVVLPGCDLATATSLLNQLRESFAGICFPVGTETFSVTFSCGIASLSRYGEAELLCKSADQALYQAKNGGRNRVVVAG